MSDLPSGETILLALALVLSVLVFGGLIGAAWVLMDDREGPEES